MGVNSPYNYDKLPTMSLSPPHNYSSPTNTLSGNGNGLHSPQKSMSPNEYDSAYGADHRDLLSSGRQIQVFFFNAILKLKYKYLYEINLMNSLNVKLTGNS